MAENPSPTNDPKDMFFISLGIRFRRVFGREMTDQERHYFTLAEQETRRNERKRSERPDNPTENV